MSLKKLTAIIITSALLLTASTFFLIPMAAGSSNRPFTQDQVNLIAEKDRALRESGIDPKSRIDEKYQRPTFETNISENEVRMTKQELLDRWNQGWNADQEYIRQLDQGGPVGAARALEIRSKYERERQEIEKLPSEGKTLKMSEVAIGEHSAHLNQWTWESTTKAVDPINIMWFNIGSAWDVNFDMNNWTVQTDWSETSCGGTQWAYIFDAGHTGGWNGWRQQQYQQQAGGNGASCCGGIMFVYFNLLSETVTRPVLTGGR